MIVEIAGVDGSGKSTVINHLIRAYSGCSGRWAYERTLRADSSKFLELIALRSGCLDAEELFDPKCVEFAAALEMVNRSRQMMGPSEHEPRQLFFVSQYRASWVAGALERCPEIIDQVALLFEYLPRPVLAVHLRLSAQEAYRRISTRSRGDRVLTCPAPMEVLERRIAAFDRVPDHLPYPIKSVDAGQSQSLVCLQIRDMLDSALGDCPRSAP
jgi:thymidylate kinase